MIHEIIRSLKEKKGLHILFGMPRSGKSKIIKDLQKELSSELAMSREEERCVTLYKDEFDSEIYDDMLEDFVPDILKFCEINKKVKYILIDSAKSILYGGNSLRKGGISNNVYNELNDLSYISKYFEVSMLLAFSPTSANFDVICEIASILASCSANFIAINEMHEVIMDGELRMPVSAIIKHISNSK